MKRVVIGAGGGIGGALVAALQQAGHAVWELGRGSEPAIDLLDEGSIAAAAARCGPGLLVVIDATGFLHENGQGPEKSLARLDPGFMARNFALNAIGPALLMKHFLPLLDRHQRAVFATLSARVGSITDNRLGGWYSYRASKAALNQLVRTAAIELARTHPQAICAALHPGTVETALSRPFARTGLEVQSPAACAARLLAVIDELTPARSGTLVDYRGAELAF